MIISCFFFDLQIVRNGNVYDLFDDAGNRTRTSWAQVFQSQLIEIIVYKFKQKNANEKAKNTQSAVSAHQHR